MTEYIVDVDGKWRENIILHESDNIKFKLQKLIGVYSVYIYYNANYQEIGIIDVRIDYAFYHPMHEAAEMGNLQALIKWINIGTEIDILNIYNVTPLMAACINNQIDIIKYLLKCGANSNVIDKYGNTLLFNVVFSNNIEMLDLFITTGCDLTCNGDITQVKKIIEIATNPELIARIKEANGIK